MSTAASPFKRIAYAAIGMGLSIGVTLLLFDLAAFHLLPHRLVEQFPEYRKSTLPRGFAGRGSYPQHYFVEDPVTGFDIGPNRTGQHWVEGETFEIWSNALGCYDEDHDRARDYVYLVGDSYTWGYAPYEEKFGKLLQDSAGWPVYKCGVTHTGQRHQLEKLLRIEQEVGRAPVAMITMWYLNDIANDHYFPHTTVIEGWQVDTVATAADGTAIPQDRALLAARVKQRIKDFENAPPPVPPYLRDQLLNYSLTLNLVRWCWHRLFPKAENAPVGGTVTGASDLGTVYDVEIERDGRLYYRANPVAAENKAALLELKQHAHDVGALFAVLIIPPREHTTDPKWHAEVHEFLDANGISYIDLATEFAEGGENADTVFLMDGHFNRHGNRVVAELIESRYGAGITTQMQQRADTTVSGAH